MWWPYDGQRNLVENWAELIDLRSDEDCNHVQQESEDWKHFDWMLRFDDKSEGLVMNMMNFGIFWFRYVCVRYLKEEYEVLAEDIGNKWIILSASVWAKGVMNIVHSHPYNFNTDMRAS